ncbi:hypothetical protein RCL1_004786 [Eukaryota sp. TZLM3-RCL]
MAAVFDPLVKPHIDSYNYFLSDGLKHIVQYSVPLEFDLPGYSSVRLAVEQIQIHEPQKPGSSSGLQESLFPRDAREGDVTYGGVLDVTFSISINNAAPESFSRRLGVWPIMLRSSLCHLSNMTEAQRIAHKEDVSDPGGYFIVEGLERLIRLLILTRRNFPLCMIRSSWLNRGPRYTHFGVSYRGVLPDESSITNVLHYLEDGTITVRFAINKAEYFVSLSIILKSLFQCSDKLIFDYLISRSDPRDVSFVKERLELLLSSIHHASLFNYTDARALLGKRFRPIFSLPKIKSDEEVGEYLIQNFILVNLKSYQSKFFMLLEMLRRLYSLTNGTISPDNPDSAMHQEILLPGHLATMYLKEQLQTYLIAMKKQMEVSIHQKPDTFSLFDSNQFKLLVNKVPSDVGRKWEYVLSTGNLRSSTGLDLMQQAGYSIVAERLNLLRFIAHFRSVHRGQFFTEMKTTSVRKLLPESYGFFCPVHTPDGSPCGLLNHLASDCHVSNQRLDDAVEIVTSFLLPLGLIPSSLSFTPAFITHYPVFVDGNIVGFIPNSKTDLANFSLEIRKLKLSNAIPNQSEIAIIHSNNIKQDPGVFIFTTPSRVVRQVFNRFYETLEWVGSFEQVFMSIANQIDRNSDVAVSREVAIQSFFGQLDQNGRPFSSHVDLSPLSMLSFVARLTPFSDFNQSPRNMYQCQMAKQSMATPCHNYFHRVDNKLYRLLFPQAPLVRTSEHPKFDLNIFPGGFNAMVAVIAHTGYSMEDACIINKGSYERGLGHGNVYTTQDIDLTMLDTRPGEMRHVFSNLPIAATGALGTSTPVLTENGRFCQEVDDDGIILPGTFIKKGSVIGVSVDTLTGKPKIHKYRKDEPCHVESVTLIGPMGSSSITTGAKSQSKRSSSQFNGPLRKIRLKLRTSRNPMVGDKFSSRHGQKGVVSIIWPQEDMPFTSEGLVPDIIINPHAFPSRMTIGMLIESMAGKSAAIKGDFVDASPFQFSEEERAVDYFGNQLSKLGYDYYGTDTMYCGLTGNELSVRIFYGLVHYQRLRHMVSDKFQVRSTGPVNQITKQPIKGRKVGGGIRFGEMERDSLISHGGSFLIQDRLLNCSDRHVAFVCKECNSLLSMVTDSSGKFKCCSCQTESLVRVKIPFVFQYLTAELAAMNVKLELKTK